MGVCGSDEVTLSHIKPHSVHHQQSSISAQQPQYEISGKYCKQKKYIFLSTNLPVRQSQQSSLPQPTLATTAAQQPSQVPAPRASTSKRPAPAPPSRGRTAATSQPPPPVEPQPPPLNPVVLSPAPSLPDTPPTVTPPPLPLMLPPPPLLLLQLLDPPQVTLVILLLLRVLERKDSTFRISRRSCTMMGRIGVRELMALTERMEVMERTESIISG